MVFHPLTEKYHCKGTGICLSLYDDARLKNPAAENKETSWDSIDEQVTADFQK